MLTEELSDRVSSVKSLVAKKASQIDANNEMDREVIELLFKNGLMGIFAPETHGGLNLGYFEASLVAEELGKVSAGVAHSVVVHHMAVDALRKFGSEDQKKKWLNRLVKESVGTLAITEPAGGSDVAGMKMEAKKEGDRYILNGRKTLITNAVFGNVIIVIARTGEGPKGLTAFIVEKDGVVVTKLNATGMRGSGLASVGFRNIEVSEENILGGEGNGMKVALATLAPNRIPFAAMGVGIARRCFELAKKYAKERDAFGKKVADFQGIQWMIAEVATEIEAVSRLVYNSARVADGMEYEIDATTLGAMCKLKVAEVTKRAADLAVEIFGGHGVISGSPVERAYRDAKILDIAEGTSEIMKVIISRTVLK
jgi:isovaleryl-CoA dehydrogenase